MKPQTFRLPVFLMDALDFLGLNPNTVSLSFFIALPILIVADISFGSFDINPK
jgi:hypothetical protein